MKTQRPVDFVDLENYSASRQARFFEGKLKPAQNIEYAVLLGHVLVEDLLLYLLALRLRADPLPHRKPGFEMLPGLAFAGRAFETEREILDLLNRARNEVSHRLERTIFDDSLHKFCQLLWDMGEGHEEKRTTPFRWSSDEQSQLLLFIIALSTLVPHLVGALARIPVR